MRNAQVDGECGASVQIRRPMGVGGRVPVQDERTGWRGDLGAGGVWAMGE